MRVHPSASNPTHTPRRQSGNASSPTPTPTIAVRMLTSYGTLLAGQTYRLTQPDALALIRRRLAVTGLTS